MMFALPEGIVDWNHVAIVVMIAGFVFVFIMWQVEGKAIKAELVATHRKPNATRWNARAVRIKMAGCTAIAVVIVYSSAVFVMMPRYDLRLMSSMKDASTIPTTGKGLMIVAGVDQGIHFRLFDDSSWTDTRRNRTARPASRRSSHGAACGFWSRASGPT